MENKTSRGINFEVEVKKQLLNFLETHFSSLEYKIEGFEFKKDAFENSKQYREDIISKLHSQGMNAYKINEIHKDNAKFFLAGIRFENSCKSNGRLFSRPYSETKEKFGDEDMLAICPKIYKELDSKSINLSSILDFIFNKKINSKLKGQGFYLDKRKLYNRREKKRLKNKNDMNDKWSIGEPSLPNNTANFDFGEGLRKKIFASTKEHDLAATSGNGKGNAHVDMLTNRIADLIKKIEHEQSFIKALKDDSIICEKKINQINQINQCREIALTNGLYCKPGENRGGPQPIQPITTRQGGQQASQGRPSQFNYGLFSHFMNPLEKSDFYPQKEKPVFFNTETEPFTRKIVNDVGRPASKKAQFFGMAQTNIPPKKTYNDKRLDPRTYEERMGFPLPNDQQKRLLPENVEASSVRDYSLDYLFLPSP